MKRTDRFMKAVTVLLSLAVVAYIGFYLYNAFANVFVTTPAIRYTIEETFSSDGFVVRSESVLADVRGNNILPIVADGVRVASGQAIAVEYTTSSALHTAGEIRSLRMRIAQLEAANNNRTAGSVRLDSVMDLSEAVNSGNLSRLDEMTVNIETLIFDTGSSDETGLDAMRARLATLEARTEGVRTFHAPFSGTFSQVIDGFEHVSSADLADISPTQLTDLFGSPINTNSAGRLVTSFNWHFAALMNFEEARNLRVGTSVTLQFAGAFHTDKEMRVQSIGAADEHGNAVVVFSSDRHMHEIVNLRHLNAQVIYNTITGIRVPKEAVHFDESDNSLFIFLQTGARAERVSIEILREYGDVYIVRDGLETGSPLRQGSTIIVRANNLYHGKVVGQ